MGLGLGGADWISESFDGLKLVSLITEVFRSLSDCEVEGVGDMGRDPGTGVEEPVG